MFEQDDIIKSTNIFLAAKDKNLKYLYCNENVACGLGLDSPKQIVGKTDYELFPDDLAKTYRSGDEYVLKGNVLINAREIQPQVNKVIKILVTKNQLKNKSGDMLGVVISFIDASNIKGIFTNELMPYDSKKQIYTFQIGREEGFFTKREYEVFRALLFGFTAKQIGKQLSMSPRTAETHIEHIRLKLQCSSKHRIIEAAMRYGIVQNYSNT